MRIGMLGRFFAGNWRPPADEIRFAAANGFCALQIRSDRAGGIAEELRADLAGVGVVLEQLGVGCVVEMLLRFDKPVTIAEALRANVPALHALGTRRVHIHPVPGAAHIDAAEIELALPEQFSEACALAEAEGLVLGVEHNAREHRLLVGPEACERLLTAVPALSLVWDLNHTEPEQVAGFQALADRLSLVHASDTPLPETNHHLPVGLGTVDFTVLRAVDVPIILEIGGLPVSGGYGRDTDDALVDSRARLRALS